MKAIRPIFDDIYEPTGFRLYWPDVEQCIKIIISERMKEYSEEEQSLLHKGLMEEREYFEVENAYHDLLKTLSTLYEIHRWFEDNNYNYIIEIPEKLKNFAKALGINGVVSLGKRDDILNTRITIEPKVFCELCHLLSGHWIMCLSKCNYGHLGFRKDYSVFFRMAHIELYIDSGYQWKEGEKELYFGFMSNIQKYNESL